jgi:hypothetical protein
MRDSRHKIARRRARRFCKHMAAGWRFYLSRLAMAFCFVLVAASAHAQIGPKEFTLAGVSDCIKEAIGTSSVEDNGPVIIFSCSATRAKTLFSFLGRKVRVEVVQDRNGKFENRQFGNSACYHRIEEPSGKAADDFRCDLILTIGDALSE